MIAGFIMLIIIIQMEHLFILNGLGLHNHQIHMVMVDIGVVMGMFQAIPIRLMICIFIILIRGGKLVE